MQKYFDYNATTPLDHAVIESMFESVELFGNPSSSHRMGREMRFVLDKARHHAAKILQTDSESIIFTSGGSESNNMVIKGYLHRYYRDPGHLITSCIEHPSVLEIFHYLKHSLMLSGLRDYSCPQRLCQITLI